MDLEEREISQRPRKKKKKLFRTERERERERENVNLYHKHLNNSFSHNKLYHLVNFSFVHRRQEIKKVVGG